MDISFTKEDLMTLRRTITDHADYMNSFPTPEASGYSFATAHKMVRKINAAIKRSEGHDCMGDFFLDKCVRKPSAPQPPRDE